MTATFIPTDEWQEVPEGAICPPGLEYNINLETGVRQARIPNGHAKPGHDSGQDDLDNAYEQQNPDMAPALAAAALDLAALAGKTPPPRHYAWNPWIPARMATLLHSFGGVGKSSTKRRTLECDRAKGGSAGHNPNRRCILRAALARWDGLRYDDGHSARAKRQDSHIRELCVSSHLSASRS